MSVKQEKKRAARLAATEAALAIECPACGVPPQVWCGPVLEVVPFGRAVEPWMHDRRYQRSA